MVHPLSEATRLLGENITAVRNRRGCKQDEIAHLAGLNVSNYGRIERGAGNPTFHTLVKIAGALECELSEFVKGIRAEHLPDGVEVFTVHDFLREKKKRTS